MNNFRQLTLKVAFPRNINGICKVNNYMLMNHILMNCDTLNKKVGFICMERSHIDIKLKLLSLINKV